MIILRNKFFTTFDFQLILSVIFLVFFGLAAIYSVALGRGGNEFSNLQKQIIFLLLGLPLMVAVSFMDYRFWRKLAWIGYFISLVLLVLVLTPLGSTVKGARGWFDFGFFSFQPIELSKIFLIMTLADVCSRYTRTLYKLPQLIFMAGLVAIPVVLAMIQPDFGSAMVLVFIWLAAFLLVVQKKWHAILIFGSIIILLAGAWLFVLKDYQKDRIYSFLDPGRDPQGQGYNVRQSVIAVGAGKLTGRGLGFGSQSQLKFIPESQTDFIFAVIAEEIGFIGVSLLLFLFAAIFWRFYQISLRAPDDFGLFVILLSSAMLFFHILINIGMCIGLLPVTGISLPLVSYGGSFLLTVLILMGGILSIYRYGKISKG